jgi:transporter family-2 protein
MNAPTLAFYVALSTVGGILIPIMAALSGGLGRTLDNPWMAAAIVSGGGFALTLAFALLNGGANISWESLQQTKPAQLLAGAGFAFYLLSITWVGPRFGIGNAVMFVLAGQIISSAVYRPLWPLRRTAKADRPVCVLLGLVVMAVRHRDRAGRCEQH